jgi:hypothetical protein
MAVWIDAAGVHDITGRTPTDESLTLAQSIVEDIAQFDGDFTTDGVVSSKNQTRLRKAVAYEAVWLDSHPDALDAMDVEGTSADGVSGTYKGPHAAYLSPLAWMNLKRVTWLKGPIRIGSRSRALLDDGDRDDAVRDDAFRWTPMEGGVRVGAVDGLAGRSGMTWGA